MELNTEEQPLTHQAQGIRGEEILDIQRIPRGKGIPIRIPKGKSIRRVKTCRLNKL
jgi:hypothetical protein